MTVIVSQGSDVLLMRANEVSVAGRQVRVCVLAASIYIETNQGLCLASQVVQVSEAVSCHSLSCEKWV